MLAQRVQPLLHLEVLALDAQIVAPVQLVQHLGGLHGLRGHVLVDLRRFPLKHYLDVLQFGQEKLEVANALLLCQTLLLPKQRV